MPRLPRKFVFTVIGSVSVYALVRLKPSEAAIVAAISAVAGMFGILTASHAATEASAIKNCGECPPKDPPADTPAPPSPPSPPASGTAINLMPMTPQPGMYTTSTTTIPLHHKTRKPK